MPRGGYRPNAKGPKKGTKYRPTLEKEAARKVMYDLVMAKLAPMTDAQIENALGFKYLMVRAKNGGKFLRVTESMAKAKLGEDEEIVEVWEKDPNVTAFADLMNRTLGKPVENVAVEAKITIDELDARIEAGRKRVARARAAK